MFSASVPEFCTVMLTQDEWSQMYGRDGGKSSEWCNNIAKKLSGVNPYCCFAFKKGWLQKKNSRKKAVFLFKAKAYCTFSNCSVTCDIHVTKHNDTNHVKLHIAHSGKILHKGEERRARHLKGVERTAMQVKLEHQSPSSLYSKGMQKLSLDKLASGSRDGIGRTKEVLQKVSSEARKKEQRDEDIVASLLLLQQEFVHSTISSRHPGYIRRIHCSPFSVMCYTEVGVRIYHHLVKAHPLFCDATGTIATLKREKKLPAQPALLYYSLVVQHPHGDSPVAVAEMLTSEHSITSVSHFLECFRREEAVIYGFRNVSTPSKIVIDRSLVLLNSFLRVYNSETLTHYLHRCFRIVTGCAEERDYNCVCISACVSHVMNSGKHLCRRLL